MNSSVPSPISDGIAEPVARADECVCDLQCEGFRILQKPGAFRFGTDAVLPSDFVTLKRNARVADLGAGTGIIAILLAAHHPGSVIDAVEIQPDMADMAARSVRMNGLETRVRVHPMDMRDAPAKLGNGRYDAVVCNPPYFKAGAALLSQSENKRISRHDVSITLDEICRTANRLLKSGGRFSAVFPAQRVFELMTAMERFRLSPKRIRCVQHTAAHAPGLMLVDGVKDGGAQLHWLLPLVLRNEDDTPTDEWKRIYGEN